MRCLENNIYRVYFCVLNTFDRHSYFRIDRYDHYYDSLLPTVELEFTFYAIVKLERVACFKICVTISGK